MKHKLFAFLLFSFLFCHSQNEIFDEDILVSKSEEIIVDALKRIENPEEAGCTYDLGDFMIEHYFDNDGRLVKTVKTNNIASAAILGNPTTEIYDLKGNLVLRRKQGFNGEIYFLTIFKYNSFNLLEEEYHLDTNYIYRLFHKNNSNYKLNKKIYYNSKGKRVHSWKRAKRKNQKKLFAN
ncbi:hypothetical protein [Winogradskyella sp.]|uniref:hypothetical protein n=1 Tax=Winogradskyella sp. TaxID=1883156 RepID=UPI003F6CDDD1